MQRPLRLIFPLKELKNRFNRSKGTDESSISQRSSHLFFWSTSKLSRNPRISPLTSESVTELETMKGLISDPDSSFVDRISSSMHFASLNIEILHPETVSRNILFQTILTKLLTILAGIHDTSALTRVKLATLSINPPEARTPE